MPTRATSGQLEARVLRETERLREAGVVDAQAGVVDAQAEHPNPRPRDRIRIRHRRHRRRLGVAASDVSRVVTLRPLRLTKASVVTTVTKIIIMTDGVVATAPSQRELQPAWVVGQLVVFICFGD